MTEMVHVDHEQLVSYLYDECDAGARARVAAHLSACASCADEIAALTATRQHLADWAPPDVALGFQITRPSVAAEESATPAAVLRPARWWSRPLPAWAQAAAAVLIFGAGLAVGSGRGSIDRVNPGASPGGGAARSAPAGASEGAQAQERRITAAAPPAVSQTLVAASAGDDRMTRLLEQLRADLATLKRAANVAPAAAPDRELVEQVKLLIDESEQRQRIEFTARSAQLARDFEMQRRVDLARVNETIGRVQGQAGVEVRQNRQAIEGLARVVGLGAAPR